MVSRNNGKFGGAVRMTSAFVGALATIVVRPTNSPALTTLRTQVARSWHRLKWTRMNRLLDMVENAGGDLKRSDDAEQRAIDELRAMGQELLQAWGQRLAAEEAGALVRREDVVHQVKKTALAQHLR